MKKLLYYCYWLLKTVYTYIYWVWWVSSCIHGRCICIFVFFSLAPQWKKRNLIPRDDNRNFVSLPSTVSYSIDLICQENHVKGVRNLINGFFLEGINPYLLSVASSYHLFGVPLGVWLFVQLYGSEFFLYIFVTIASK